MPSLTDLKLQLDFDLNVAAFLSKLNTVNKQVSAQLDAHVQAYNDQLNRVAQAREKLEAKFYTAEERREAALSNLIKQQQELNLSERAFYGLKKEIEAIYEREAGITARNAQIKAEANARETEALNEQLRLKNEIDRIETSNLTSSQRYAHEVHRLRELKSAGLSDDAFNAEVAKAKARYDNDVANFEAAERRKVEAAKRAQKEIYDANPIVAQIRDEQDKISKITAFREKKRKEQEAADKQARKEIIDASYNSPVIKQIRQQEGKAEFDRQKEQKRIKDETDALKEQNKVYQTIHKIRTQQAAVQTRNDRERNANIQRAVSLLRSLESEEQRLVRIQNELNAAMQRGEISAAQYAQALQNIDHRQRSMASGGMRMSYVVGNLATGFEDFVTVMSITGFRMDSFAAGVRAASNNIGQAARMSGHALGHMLAPAMSLGAIGVGLAIPALYKWATGISVVEEEYKSLASTLKQLADIQKEMRGAQNNIADILNLKLNDPQQTQKDVIETLKRNLTDAEEQVKLTAGVINQTSEEMYNKLFGEDNARRNAMLVDTLRKLGLDPKIPESLKFKTAANEIEAALKRVRTAIETGNEENVKVALKGMEDIKSKYDLLATQININTGRGSGLFPAFSSGIKVGDITQTEEEIKAVEQARQDENAALREKDKLIAEIAANEQRLIMLEKQATIERDKRIHSEQQQRDEELQKLKEQVKRSTLDGANAAIFDLSMRRREMLESGIGSPAELEGLFNQELGGRRAAILKSMRDKEIDSFSAQNNTASLVRAFTDANKQALSGQFKPEDRDRKEMLKELKAINQHLAGKKIMLEVVN